MHRPLILLAGVLAGGAAGYFPMRQIYIAQQAAFERQLRQLHDEVRVAEERSHLADAVAQLGGVLVKAEERDFAQARARCAKFFDAVERLRAAAPEGRVKQALTSTLAQRGEITAGLGGSSGVAIPKLRELHSALQQLLE